MTDTPKAVQLAKAYLAALQAKDSDAILALVTEDFELDIPMNIAGTNDRSDNWKGRAAAGANYTRTFGKIALIRYIDMEYSQAADPAIAFAEGRGLMRTASGNNYDNNYIFRFDVRDGKIWRIREYANPVTAALAFGVPLPQPG